MTRHSHACSGAGAFRARTPPPRKRARNAVGPRLAATTRRTPPCRLRVRLHHWRSATLRGRSVGLSTPSPPRPNAPKWGAWAGWVTVVRGSGAVARLCNAGVPWCERAAVKLPRNGGARAHGRRGTRPQWLLAQNHSLAVEWPSVKLTAGASLGAERGPAAGLLRHHPGSAVGRRQGAYW